MVEIIQRSVSEALTYEGAAMVEISISCPSVRCEALRAAKRINAFYGHQAKALVRSAGKTVFAAAIAEYISALETSAVFRPFTVIASYEITYNDGQILSLYRDVTVRSGNAVRAHSRLGDTWCASTGWLLALPSFFRRGENYRRALTKNAAIAASELIRAGTHRFHENYERLIRRKFSRDSFYITGDGIAIFYARGDIAPESEGTPVFLYAAGHGTPVTD